MKRIETVIKEEQLEKLVASLIEKEGDGVFGALVKAREIAQARKQDDSDIRNAAITQLAFNINSSEKMPRVEIPKNIRLAILRRQLGEMLPVKPKDEIAAFALRLWSEISIAGLSEEKSLQLQELKKKLKQIEMHSFITRASSSNFQGKIDNEVNLSLEICPIYQTGPGLEKSRLVENPTSKNDILNSRVGGKWQAMEHVIHWLANNLDIPLNIKAAFADVGVLVSDENQMNPLLIESHSQVCRLSLENLCQQIHAPLEWRLLSQISPKNNEFSVEQFILTSDKKSRSKPEGFFSRDHGTFDAISELCAFNSNVAGALINTYANYPTTTDCNMALALERSETLFKLRSISFSQSWRSIPTINVLCR